MGLTYFMQHSSLKIHVHCHMSTVCSYLSSSSNSWYGLLNHSFTYWRTSGLFPVLAITKNKQTNKQNCYKLLCTDFYVCENKFWFLWNKCQSAFTGPYGSCTFSLLRNCQIVSQSSWTILHSLSQCTRRPTSLTAFSVVIIFYFNHADGVWWYLTVVYICMSLMTDDVEHLFMCFLDIGICFSLICLLKNSWYHWQNQRNQWLQINWIWQGLSLSVACHQRGFSVALVES